MLEYVPPQTAQVVVELTADEQDAWAEMVKQLLTGTEIFSTDASGLWLRGIAYRDDLGWLCLEEDVLYEDEIPAAQASVEKLWEDYEELPNHWFRLNAKAIDRAIQELIIEHGIEAVLNDETDMVDFDAALQIVLLGGIQYNIHHSDMPA